MISLNVLYHHLMRYPLVISLFFIFFSFSFAFLFNSSQNFNQSNVECETVSLDENKKFKIININQATSLDGPENEFEHKAQLIEIDKLLINTPNGPKQNASSKSGVWHQVSWFIFVTSSPSSHSSPTPLISLFFVFFCRRKVSFVRT